MNTAIESVHVPDREANWLEHSLHDQSEESLGLSRPIAAVSTIFCSLLSLEYSNRYTSFNHEEIREHNHEHSLSILQNITGRYFS